MSDDPATQRGGARPTSECRRFVRSGLDEPRLGDPALREHVAKCAFCSARAAAVARLGGAVAQPPAAPPRLHSPAFLDGIRARVVEDCEESTVGRFVAANILVSAPLATESAWPSDLLEGDFARRAMTRPEPASTAAWARVKASVLESLAAQAPSRVGRMVWARNRTLTLAGVAAAAIIFAWFASGGSQPTPEIVITDVVSMPESEFSPMTVLRHGELR